MNLQDLEVKMAVCEKNINEILKIYEDLLYEFKIELKDGPDGSLLYQMKHIQVHLI